MTDDTAEIEARIEQHDEAAIVDRDDTGRLTIEVPHTIPAELDELFREHDIEVVKKTVTRYEVQL